MKKSSLPRLVTVLCGFAVAASQLLCASSALAMAANANATLAGQTPPIVSSGAATFLGAHESTSTLKVDFGLPIRNQQQLDTLIATVAATHHYLTQSQFDATYGSTTAQVDAVKAWAQAQGMSVTFTSADGLNVIAQGSTATVERALGVDINDYRTTKGRVFYSNDRDPTIPAALGIQSVSGLSNYDQFFTGAELARRPRGTSRREARAVHQGSHQRRTRVRLRGRRARTLLPEVRPGGYFPSDMRQFYDVDGYGYDGSNQTIGLTLWGAPIADSDLSAFASNTSNRAICADTSMTSPYTNCQGADRIQWIPVDGNTYSSPGDYNEIALDTEYAHGMATNSSEKYFLADCVGSGCSPTTAGLEAAISAAANDSSLHVVSNSWGGPEASASDPFVINTENSFQHAVAVGTTFYFSTGDGGANTGGTFLPSYPADSPYVVAVGATGAWNTDAGNYVAEVGWTDSGGGCSTVFSRPSWQTGVYAATCAGRAIPDIAANGDASTCVYIYVNGGSTCAWGTSLSAPLVTGMAAVTNNYLSTNSDPLMGWAAPTIYSLANSSAYHTYFHDVTCGNNGYAAGPGWDQVTGWGSEDWYTYTLGFAGQSFAGTEPTPLAWYCDSTAGSPGDVNGISCWQPDGCYAVGAGGLAEARSGSWTADSTGVTANLNGVSCTAQVCYAVGAGGTMLFAQADSSGWHAVSSPTTASLHGVSCPSSSTCYAVGDGGTIVSTNNGTTSGPGTWSSQVSGVSSDLLGIACPSTSTCYVVGQNGVVIATTDGGLTWASQQPSMNDLYSVACTGTTSCWAVGDSGTILNTGDGVHWTSEPAPTSENLRSIACPELNVCFAGGTNGVIVDTPNAGAYWRVQTNALGGTGYTINSIGCWSAGACYTAAGTGIILRKLSVNTTADTLSCSPASWSLRCAMLNANAEGSNDIITFDMNELVCPGTPPVCTISPTTPLPPLNAVYATIDGYSQAGAQPNSNELAYGDNAGIIVHLDGSSAGSGADGLDIAGDYDRVTGLSITHFSGDGIKLTASNDTAAGNFIGETPSGTGAGNLGDGIYSGLRAGSPNSANTIGGSTADAANVIGANAGNGVNIAAGTGNTVANNLIGTNLAGTAFVANDGDGVRIAGGSDGATIGGVLFTSGNVISGNGLNGIEIVGGSHATITGNMIGTTADGSAALGNTDSGILLDPAVGALAGNALIGGTDGAYTNLIAGNGIDGITILPSGTASADDAMIEGNDIGVGLSGASLPNRQNGIHICCGSSGDVVGGTTVGAGNAIAHNVGDGVAVGNGAGDTVHVDIQGNSIYANGGLGIDLAGQDPSTCTSGPTSSQPNDDTPCPVIDTYSTAQLGGTACVGCTVEAFTTGPAPPSNYGEGQMYLGRATSDASGRWAIPLAPGQLHILQTVSATATAPATSSTPAETSEFAANVHLGIPLGTGWNVTDLAVDGTGFTSLSHVVASMVKVVHPGTIQAAAVFRNGRFNLYVPTFSPDVPLQSGDGFFVLSTGSGTWLPSTTAYQSGQPVALANGWDLVGAEGPNLSGMATSTIAAEIAKAGGTVKEIATYGNGKYNVWLPDQKSFTVAEPSGMFILCSCPQPITWTPS